MKPELQYGLSPALKGIKQKRANPLGDPSNVCVNGLLFPLLVRNSEFLSAFGTT